MPRESNTVLVDIKASTIFKILGSVSAFVLVFWLIFLIKSILLAIFLSLILALALEPAVIWLRKKKIPNSLSVIMVVFSMVIALLGLGSVALSPVISQTQILLNKLPQYLESVLNIPGADRYIEKYSDALFNQISQASGGIVNATLGAFSGAVAVTLIVVFVIYILLDFSNLRDVFVKVFPEKRQNEVKDLVNNIETKLGGWLRGQIVLMLIIGLTTFVGLTILGVDYSLALAVFAGLMEIIPIIGPIISLVPAVIIGFAISPVTGLGVIGLYILIQQLENHLIVPKVMQRAIGFNPLVTIIALTIGGKLMGIIGAVLAVPFTIVVLEIARYVSGLNLYQFTKSPRTAG